MLLEEYINQIEIDKIEKIKESISLFWYHENLYQKELWDILKENWIKINTSFIPSIDIRLLELMYKSELFIFSPNNFQKEAFEYPFKEIWTKFIEPIYPYGLENTNNWFKDILWEFNKNLQKSPWVENIIKEYKLNIDLVKNKKYKIWIVLLWLQEVKKLFSTDYMNNINIIQFLEEMWFEINFYIFDDFGPYLDQNDESYKISDWNHEKIEEIIYNNIDKWWINNITYFSWGDNLELLLNNANLNLIYSDIYFDDRITKLWINQFNLKNFYVWYSWALKTIKELINLCEMSFYKKYSQYFTN
jgi:hypothetical protein